MSKPSLAYPRRILEDEAKTIERQLPGIADEFFKSQSAERMAACVLAAKILTLFEAFESEPAA